MAAGLGLNWKITGHGSADFILTVPDEVIEIHTTYVGDGLRSLLQAAIDLAVGSSTALALLEREPGGTWFVFGGAGVDSYLQVVAFPDVQPTESRWSGGRLLWHGRVDVRQFVHQAARMAEEVLVQVGGADRYAEIWGGIAFPGALLDRLKALSAPRVIYEPVLLDDREDAIVYQGGAFPTEDEAEKVLRIWQAEGRTERMAINLVPLYETAEQWEHDR